jgi:hypothetical protein
MTGGFFLGLVLLSMLWLFAGLMLWVNASVFRKQRRAAEGERVPSGMPFLAGALASLAVFITLPLASRYLGLDVPWPWLWILLPLFFDMLGLGGWIAALFGFGRAKPH